MTKPRRSLLDDERAIDDRLRDQLAEMKQRLRRDTHRTSNGEFRPARRKQLFQHRLAACARAALAAEFSR
jgi:hypothetical protein